MHQMAKHFIKREKFDPINDIQTLVRIGGIQIPGLQNGAMDANRVENGIDPCGQRQFVIRGQDKIFRRVILRHLTGIYVAMDNRKYRYF